MRSQSTQSRPAAESGIETNIARHVRRAKPGAVFTPTLFNSLGGRAAIDKAMQRLAARGELRRLSRGLYDKPREDPLLGTLWPSVDAIVAALTGKDRLRLQPTGAYAANLLGLSDQVPARVEFLTDGTSRTVKAGPMQIVLKRTTPRQMAAAGRTSGLVIQALRSLGPDNLTSERMNKLRQTIPADQRRALLRDLALAHRSVDVAGIRGRRRSRLRGDEKPHAAGCGPGADADAMRRSHEDGPDATPRRSDRQPSREAKQRHTLVALRGRSSRAIAGRALRVPLGRARRVRLPAPRREARTGRADRPAAYWAPCHPSLGRQ